MGRRIDPPVAIGLAAMLLLLAALPYGLTRDNWWPAVYEGYAYPPIRSGDDFTAAAAPHPEPRSSALFIGLAAIDVAGGRPELVSYRGDQFDQTPANPDTDEPLLHAMLGSVLDLSEQSNVPAGIVEEARSRDLFTDGPGGIRVARQPSSDRKVVAVSQGGTIHIMPLEWLEALPEAQP